MNTSSLWLTPPDTSIALTDLTFEEVAAKLNLHAFIDRLFPFAWPDQSQTQLALVQSGVCTTTESGLLSITAAGALMLARDLAIFPQLYHAAPQVIRYAGTDRLNIADRTTFSQGFLLALPRLIDHLTAVRPPHTQRTKYVDFICFSRANRRHTRACGKRPHPSGSHRPQRASHRRDLPRPHRVHQPRTAPHGSPAHSRRRSPAAQPAAISDRQTVQSHRDYSPHRLAQRHRYS